MEYLLVLQVPGSSIRSYQEMAAIERHVAAALGELGKVDGHEAGWGEMRIFILTPKPIEAVDRLREVPEIADVMAELKAAYRKLGSDDFEVLQLEGRNRFRIR